MSGSPDGQAEGSLRSGGERGGTSLTDGTRDGEAQLRQRMAGLIGGYQLSAALGAVARLGVADALAAGPAEPQ